ncbi:MAG TPA: proline dehydrogenase family protein [Longimicrobiales bacterium]|nr:proline dehydrogenase family protein [Longimicrobiales bacterium]
MPGERLEDALAAAEQLASGKLGSLLTLLGENLDSAAEADEVEAHYHGVLDAVRARGLDAEISVKLTQLGLDFDAGGACDRLARLAAAAAPSTVWVDMESSGYVDRTLDLYRSVRAEHANVGVCLQSYLRRTPADLEALLPLDPSIRLVKGAYDEPPSIAYPDKRDVDRSFVELTARMLRATADGARGRMVVATHDPRMMAEAGRLAHELGLAPDALEYAMLYGIQQGEQHRLARNGRRVRVLISYGTHWFAWYMRRLAERPANVWFVLKQLGR